jgi:hypothetical protein
MDDEEEIDFGVLLDDSGPVDLGDYLEEDDDPVITLPEVHVSAEPEGDVPSSGPARLPVSTVEMAETEPVRLSRGEVTLEPIEMTGSVSRANEKDWQPLPDESEEDFLAAMGGIAGDVLTPADRSRKERRAREADMSHLEDKVNAGNSDTEDYNYLLDTEEAIEDLDVGRVLARAPEALRSFEGHRAARRGDAAPNLAEDLEATVVGDWTPGWLESGDAPSLGFAEGVTGTWLDEVWGSANDLVGNTADILEAGMDPHHDYEPVDHYTPARDSVRAVMNEAEEESPRAFAAAELAGGLLPAAALPNPATGSRMLSSVAGGGLYGGLAGLGSSEDDDLAGLAEDTIEGAALGAGTGGVMHGLAGGGARLLNSAGRNARLRSAGFDPGNLPPAMRAVVEADPEAASRLIRELTPATAATPGPIGASAASRIPGAAGDVRSLLDSTVSSGASSATDDLARQIESAYADRGTPVPEGIRRSLDAGRAAHRASRDVRSGVPSADAVVERLPEITEAIRREIAATHGSSGDSAVRTVNSAMERLAQAIDEGGSWRAVFAEINGLRETASRARGLRASALTDAADRLEELTRPLLESGSYPELGGRINDLAVLREISDAGRTAESRIPPILSRGGGAGGAVSGAALGAMNSLDGGSITAGALTGGLLGGVGPAAIPRATGLGRRGLARLGESVGSSSSAGRETIADIISRDPALRRLFDMEDPVFPENEPTSPETESVTEEAPPSGTPEPLSEEDLQFLYDNDRDYLLERFDLLSEEEIERLDRIMSRGRRR